MQNYQLFTIRHKICIWPFTVEPIWPGGPRPAYFLAFVGRPYLWPAHFFG